MSEFDVASIKCYITIQAAIILDGRSMGQDINMR